MLFNSIHNQLSKPTHENEHNLTPNLTQSNHKRGYFVELDNSTKVIKINPRDFTSNQSSTLTYKSDNSRKYSLTQSNANLYENSNDNKGSHLSILNSNLNYLSPQNSNKITEINRNRINSTEQTIKKSQIFQSRRPKIFEPRESSVSRNSNTHSIKKNQSQLKQSRLSNKSSDRNFTQSPINTNSYKQQLLNLHSKNQTNEVIYLPIRQMSLSEYNSIGQGQYNSYLRKDNCAYNTDSNYYSSKNSLKVEPNSGQNNFHTSYGYNLRPNHQLQKEHYDVKFNYLSPNLTSNEDNLTKQKQMESTAYSTFRKYSEKSPQTTINPSNNQTTNLSNRYLSKQKIIEVPFQSTSSSNFGGFKGWNQDYQTNFKSETRYSSEQNDFFFQMDHKNHQQVSNRKNSEQLKSASRKIIGIQQNIEKNKLIIPQKVIKPTFINELLKKWKQLQEGQLIGIVLVCLSIIILILQTFI